MSVQRSFEALAKLPSRVVAPRYKSSDLRAGIVHIGVGNFHRAHQAVYLDDLFNAGVDRDWAIIGAGVREADVDLRAKLAVQDWLTTAVEQETSVSTARVTGAMIDFVKPFDVEAMLDMLARPQFRIVSLTVTEGGYYISPATQWFDPVHPDIVQDAHNPDAPKTAFGLIAAGFKRRRTADVAPFTVMSCDNIPGNWHVTENAVAGLAELSDPSSRNGSAPTSRSRIPWSTASLRRRPIGSARSCGTRGVEDAWPVFCEEFRQWVVEDKFPTGRPALEKAGVTFTSDVAPYEPMKIRILNGGHAAIAYTAGLLDIHFVHEAMEDAQIRTLLETLTKREIIPVVPPPPQVDLEDYPHEGGRALRQSEDRRHDFARLPRRVEPAAEVHPAEGQGPGEIGRKLQGTGARFRALVPLPLRRIGERQGHSAERSELGPAAGGGAAGAQRPETRFSRCATFSANSPTIRLMLARSRTRCRRCGPSACARRLPIISPTKLEQNQSLQRPTMRGAG